MIKLVLFGSYISKDVEDDIFDNYLITAKTFSISNIIYERKLLEGLANQDKMFFSCPTIGRFPKTLKKDVTSFKNEKNIIYCNYSLKGLQLFKKIRSIKKEIDKAISKFDGYDEVIIMVMEMHLPFQLGALYLKRKLKKRKVKLKICSFCPDISKNVIDTTKHHFLGYKILKKIYSNISERLFKKSDCFVLFTKQMASYFSIPENKYIVSPAIQTMCNEKLFFGRKEKFSMLFSGKLQEKNGIQLLIDYFTSSLVDKRFILHVCGSGEMEDKIKDASTINKNIIFHGFLKPNEVQLLQSKCQIVFSLRDANWSGVQYSFPSKFLEALSTGNNVITKKLSTYDSQVDEFVFYLSDDKLETLNDVINSALRTDLKQKQKQYNYLKKFDPSSVGEEIVKFIVNI